MRRGLRKSDARISREKKVESERTDGGDFEAPKKKEGVQLNYKGAT